jgi:hypothetical protein
MHHVETGALAIASKDDTSFRAKVLATKANKARVLNLDVGNIQVSTYCSYSYIYFFLYI